MQEEMIEIDNSVAKKATFKFVAKSTLKFLKKHWKAELALAVVATVATLAFVFIPVIPVNDVRLVNLNTTVRLESGQTVKIKTSDVTVKIIHFTNDTCPKGMQCIWSGQAVEYMLTVDGHKYATGSITTENASEYRVKTVSSDYKTYANIEITKK